ncbi:MAG: putative oxidoreductase SadH [Chlamydiae bacterium]|nr:putative oxidoreductase SadH [Chlamydiota bacterium]
MSLNKFYNNKVIWITGASGGLGRQLAIHLSKYNVKLILSARQDLELKETKKIANLPDHRCLIIPLDLTFLKEDQISMITDRILLKFDSLDILIHNASLSQRSLAHETLLPVERKIMETNYFGPVQLTKYTLPTLLKSQDPQIIIMSSLAGKFGIPFRSTYSATKHALHGFFESMKLELHKKIDISFFVLSGIQTSSAKHALNADGSFNNQNDVWYDKLMPVESCAKMIVKNIPKKKSEVIIGPAGQLSLFLKKHFPLIHKHCMLRFSKKEINSRS